MARVTAAGSVLVFSATVRVADWTSRLKPTSACICEVVSVDEADGLEQLLHVWRHLPRPVVEPGDQPLGVHPRQDQFVHAPLPASLVRDVSAHARKPVGLSCSSRKSSLQSRSPSARCSRREGARQRGWHRERYTAQLAGESVDHVCRALRGAIAVWSRVPASVPIIAG